MIKKSILLALSFSLSGCAMSPGEYIAYQKSNNFDKTKFSTNSGGMQSVEDLREIYKNVTGQNLPFQDTSDCRKDNACYFNRYNDLLHDLMYQRQIETQKKENEEFARKKETECQASKECMAKREIDAASYTLNNVYYSLMARYPYQQADSDAGVRHMCRVAGAAQREGVTLEFMKQHISLTEGIGPEMRYQIIQVAEACWKMSKYGIADGTTQIKSMY
ncbi:TPA: hypothetical protein OUG30_000600 [Klebsiella pneumoniae]|uniref:hypothetical protein n=1 Tax=Klebsiella pneumoniae TaxID=573 RepID=UPI00143828A9|nr:hypothetical protein [Klebsiella pneumoniae]EKA8127146.1 hypothetical protein [Klebsiella pneumoniae]EKT9770264.1 hypothetical protein [Klebsiella pneumoniae]EKU5330926.1 hypothetical protein [Klebsiella pneumoniae]EKZ5356646.1 hypothetical protein [Klebsiella pneumoniae]EKZ6112259.1 hypothetical protein [Klebsiella pneumoniae]